MSRLWDLILTEDPGPLFHNPVREVRKAMSKDENLYPVILNSAFGTNVAFIPNPRPVARTVQFKDCLWTQGHSPEWLDKPLVKSFGTSHARLIFGLFKFFQDNGLTQQTPINVGFSGLTKILKLGQGGKNAKEVQRLLGELASIWSKVVYPDGTVEEFKILDFTTQKKNGQERLKTVCFSDGFITLLNHFDPNKIYTLLYSVLCGMSSNLAQAIYLQFTDKVVRETTDPFTEKTPWRKNITNLLQELEQVVPKYKSARAQAFTRPQGKNGSVIDQLTGVPIQQPNIILHAKLEENASGDDYNLCLWCERQKKPKSTEEKGEAATLSWWRLSGRSDEEYRQRLKADRKICTKVFEDLDECGYPVQKNRRFLEIANKLLNFGELEELAADCKYRIMTGSGITNIGAYLHASIRNGIIEQSISERVLGIEENEE